MDTSPDSSFLHLACDRSVLVSAIQAADAVVPSNSTKPILTNLLLDAKKGQLEVIATDLQVGLRSVVKPVEVSGIGQAVVQARQLAAILKESSSPSVTLRLDQRAEQSQLQIRLSDGDYQVPAIIGETFPPVSFFPGDAPVIPISGKRLDEMIRQTVFAMDKDRTSAVLSGLYLSVANGEFVLAATDGKVLCEAVEKSERYGADPAQAVQVVIPALTIGHLQRVMGSVQPDRIELAFAAKLLFIRLAVDGGLVVEFTSRLVEGNFPAYRNALPTSAPTSVTFASADLASAVRRAALMTTQTSRGIILALDRDVAVFSNLNYTNGSARIPVPCDYQGATVKLGLNAQYLGDVLKVYKAEKIGIELSRGLIMREPGATYLVMPISLPN